jgi:hypothetical protein
MSDLTPEEIQFQETQQAAMDDLDYEPSEDEGTTPEPEVKGQEPEPTPETAEPEPEKKEGEPASEPPVVDEAAELLKTYKEQLGHFQKLYEERDKELKAERERAAAAQPPPKQAGPPQLTQAQIREHYIPEVQKTVEQGYMSPEFVQSFPDEATQMLYHRDIIYGLVKRVTEVVNFLNTQHQQGQAGQADTMLNGLFDAVVKEKGEFFKPLATPEVREGFKKYLTELNPYTEQLNPDFIARQYLAYNQDAILEAARMAAGGKPNPNPKANARGEGGTGNRGKAPQSQSEARPWDDI